MIIKLNSLNGCDKISHVYGGMFNMLQEIMQDEDKLKKLAPPDFSALGMYIAIPAELTCRTIIASGIRRFVTRWGF